MCDMIYIDSQGFYRLRSKAMSIGPKLRHIFAGVAATAAAVSATANPHEANAQTASANTPKTVITQETNSPSASPLFIIPAEGDPFTVPQANKVRPVEPPKEPIVSNPQAELLEDIYTLSLEATKLSGTEIQTKLNEIATKNDISFTKPKSGRLTDEARAIFTALANKAGLESANLPIMQPGINSEAIYQAAVAASADELSNALIADITDQTKPETNVKVKQTDTAKLNPAQKLQAEMQKLGDLVDYTVPKDQRPFTQKLLGRQTAQGFETGLGQALADAVAKAQGKLPVEIASKVGVFPGDYNALGAGIVALREYVAGYCDVPEHDQLLNPGLVDPNPFIPGVQRSRHNDAAYFVAAANELAEVREHLEKLLRNPVEQGDTKAQPVKELIRR